MSSQKKAQPLFTKWVSFVQHRHKLSNMEKQIRVWQWTQTWALVSKAEKRQH